MPGSKSGPLAGVRVLELARILAGPWAGQVLADLGADVIKVERSKTGDDTRAWGPPFIEGKDGHLGAAYFHSTNRGKRSIECDFESEDGKRIVRKLAAKSDILIENFKVGGLAEVRARLREPRAVLPAADLLLGDRLRPDRPARLARRLRPDGAGHRRLHGTDRHGGRRADARRRAGVGYLHRRLFGDRHSGGVAAARAHRQGRLCRYRAGRLDGRRAGEPGDELSRLRRRAEAHRQCASQHRAVSGVSGSGRPHHHRDGQRLAIRQALRCAGRAGACEEPGLSGQQGPAEQSRQAGRRIFPG